jgi:hypothetical protein
MRAPVTQKQKVKRVWTVGALQEEALSLVGRASPQERGVGMVSPDSASGKCKPPGAITLHSVARYLRLIYRVLVCSHHPEGTVTAKNLPCSSLQIASHLTTMNAFLQPVFPPH